jgi:hypothetical protein
MAELTQKKRKGHGVEPPAQVISLEPPDPLYFMTSHPTKPAQVKLHMFATGATVEDAPRTIRRSFVPFSGRPRLILELAPHIRGLYGSSPSSSVEQLMKTLRWWWRHLDKCLEVAPVASIRDLNDIHYASYRASPSTEGVAQSFFKIVDFARQSQSLPSLYWTAVQDPDRVSDLIAYEDVRRIYHFIKRPAFDALLRYEEDPDYQPTRIEILYLFTLFIMSSGWNAQTALDIDIVTESGNGELNCIIPHPQNDAFCYVRSQKARAGGSIQYALSRKQSQLSPSNIVLALRRQTAVLRKRLNRYLCVLKWQLKRWEKHGVKTAVEINELKTMIADISREVKSPWLFAKKTTTGGERRYLPISDIGVLKKYYMDSGANEMRTPLVVWARRINSQLPPGQRPLSENMVLADLRDAYISWRWERSGYSWLDAMLAAGHKSMETLKRYLNKKQHKAASRREFLKVGDALWATVMGVRGSGAANSLPTVVAAKVAGATDEQVVRWLSSKDQTYVGTGCADFHNPPEIFAPDHQPGDGCRFQRCTLCEHAILLHESYHHLAKRLVELHLHQSTISTASWLESDYPCELKTIEIALSAYKEKDVRFSISYWEDQIRDGAHSVLSMEGAYA